MTIEKIESIPELGKKYAKSKNGHTYSVFAVKRPTVILFTTPPKKKKETAEKMAAKWMLAHTDQLTRIAERKIKLNLDLAERLMVKYREIDRLESERTSLGAKVKGLNGDIRSMTKEAAAPVVELRFNWVDDETKAPTGGKPDAKSPAGKAKKATKKAVRKPPKKGGRKR